MAATKADWNVELNCLCPMCDTYVNLIDYEDFWDRDLDVCEHGTTRSKGMEVVCPKCFNEFNVDCEY